MDGYDPAVTELCERALVTILGSAGFWGHSMYLVGGLAVRYLVDGMPGAAAHIGSRDVDLAVVMAIDGDGADYETLARNLRENGFVQAPRATDPAFRWRTTEDKQDVVVEFLGETEAVGPGRMFKPRAGAGNTFQALNVPGVRLLPVDHLLKQVTADRFGGGGISTVEVRVAGLMPYLVLKARAFRDRHHPKDAYDLIYALMNQSGGAAGAGRSMARSPVAQDGSVIEAIAGLETDFGDPGRDGPTDYARFLDVADDPEQAARFRNEAALVVETAITEYRRSLTAR